MQFLLFVVGFIPILIFVHWLPFLLGKIVARRGSLEIIIACCILIILPFAFDSQIWMIIDFFHDSPRDLPELNGTMAVIGPLLAMAKFLYKILIYGAIYPVLLEIDARYPVAGLLGLSLTLTFFMGRSYTASKIFVILTVFGFEFDFGKLGIIDSEKAASQKAGQFDVPLGVIEYL